MAASSSLYVLVRSALYPPARPDLLSQSDTLCGCVCGSRLGRHVWWWIARVLDLELANVRGSGLALCAAPTVPVLAASSFDG